jgi:rhodanese-related sulfurtransferase
MEDKLRFHTDSWDLSVDLKAGLAAIVVIDARSRDAYIAGHIIAQPLTGADHRDWVRFQSATGSELQR